MIEVGVGSSRKEDSREAAAEAAHLAMSRAGMIRADFVLFFITPDHSEHYPKVIEKIKNITGAPHIAGCSGIGVLTHEEEIEQGPGIAVMAVHSDTLFGYSFLFHDLLERDLSIGHAIGEFLQSFRRGAELLVLFPDPYSLEASVLASGIQEGHRSPLSLIGGCSSNETHIKQTYQFSEKGAATSSLSGIYLTGEFTHSIGITQTFHPVTGPLIVTKADGKRILELRGRPSLDYLKEIVKEPFADNLSEALKNIMLGFAVDPFSTELKSGQYLVRNITGMDPSDGSLMTREEVTEGQPVSFVIRDKERARQEFEELLEDFSQFSLPNPPRFGLYFNCAGRGNSLYGTPNEDIELIRKYLGEIPLIGFFSFGEIAPINEIDCLHTFSGILTLISDSLE